MKTELKAKLLQHLNQKKSDQGFTLIELLVVIIIIGILSAIALPSFLNQANKAKQSEAKTYVGSMNRAQQAYYLENTEFVADNTLFSDLGLGVATQTANYKYTVEGIAKGDSVTNLAEPKVKDSDVVSSLKAYQGGVQIGQQEGTGEATTLAVLCEAKKPRITGGDPGDESKITFGTGGAGPECDDAIYKDLNR